MLYPLQLTKHSFWWRKKFSIININITSTIFNYLNWKISKSFTIFPDNITFHLRGLWWLLSHFICHRYSQCSDVCLWIYFICNHCSQSVYWGISFWTYFSCTHSSSSYVISVSNKIKPNVFWSSHGYTCSTGRVYVVSWASVYVVAWASVLASNRESNVKQMLWVLS